MSNGYLVAASADISRAQDIAGGFGLEAVDGSTVSDREAAAAELANAANVGLLISHAAAADANYVALLQTLAQRLARAQLILVDADARAAFAFLPAAWPAMSFDDAHARATALARQRGEHEQSKDAEPPRAHPLPPTPEEEQPATGEEPDDARADEDADQAIAEEAPHADEDAKQTRSEASSPPPRDEYQRSPEISESGAVDHAEEPEADAPTETEAEDEPSPSNSSDDALEEELSDIEPSAGEQQDELTGGAAPEPEADDDVIEAPPAPPSVEPPAPPASVAPPEHPAPASPAPMPTPPPQVAPPARVEPPESLSEESFGRAIDMRSSARSRTDAQRPGEQAPADATAFAPKKLRRGTPELVRIVVHQPKDLNEVIKAAKKIDPRAEPAPSGVSIGDVALGSSIGVSLEVRGATADGALQRRTWAGEPIDFSFAVEADASVKQVVLLARVFVDDAQIGVLAFTRNVSGPAAKPHSTGDRVRLKRHKRVFLSYSSKDRETVSQIATAYQMAGIEHFWDRASLKSGEEWHPRLRREIDRADLFHLCWSKAAAESEWVQKEAEHALTRRRRNSGKPDITVQMLDGPPWAPHPRELDAINFDDFVRAAIVGYARGDVS